MLRKKDFLLAAGVSLAVLSIVAGTDPSHAQTYPDGAPAKLAAGRLDDALRLFAEQNGLQIIYLSKVTDNVRTAGAPAGMPPRQTLASLLKGTGLRFRFTDANTVTIFDAQSEKLAADPPNVTPDPPKADGLENIVVTAQKRSEKVQNVPITMTVITARSAAALGVANTTDLAEATPGLVMHHQTNTLAPSLRGLSSVNASLGDESPIAIYVDGVYYTAMSAGVFAFNNIQDIEILKGPQGTLFGRNATGGVIQVTTKTPQQKPYINTSIGYGNYNTLTGTLYATSGITPKIAADISLNFERQYDGWGRNVTTGGKTFTNREFDARSKWLFTLGDSTQATVALDYENNSNPIGTGKDQIPGTVNPLIGPPHSGGNFDLQENKESKNLLHQWGASAQVNHDFGWARLVSISAYRSEQAAVVLDQDASAANYELVSSSYFTREITQELQLLSPDTSKIQWIVGLFYLNNLADSNLTLSGTGLPAALGHVEWLRDQLTTQSEAGFAQATIPILPKLDFTTGLRYTSDQQTIKGGAYGGATAPLFLIPGNGANQNKTFDKPTWRESLQYHFDPHFMGYVSYNRGFKSGAYNATAPTGAAVNPEVIDAYEVGAKTDWLNGRLRLDGSVYDYDVSNLQLSISQLGHTLLLNAASASIKGTELDFQAIPVQHLTLSGGISYLNAKYSKFFGAPYVTPLLAGGYSITPGNGSGNDLIYTPKLTYNLTAQYKIPMPSGVYSAAMNYYYNSGYFPDTANQFHQSAYHLLDASVDWVSPNNQWDVRLWAKNLTDAHYYNAYGITAFSAAASPAAPRTFGITLGYKWGAE